jgi:hypothetical protein
MKVNEDEVKESYEGVHLSLLQRLQRGDNVCFIENISVRLSASTHAIRCSSRRITNSRRAGGLQSKNTDNE